ncbi:pH-response regulator protein palC [Aureobasidium sp. EXF-12298]|nr:pH-response regulator protein palC [Aureobasidium sp. EXF-12298]
MPYPFTLPTTSSTPLDTFISSPSHPSLPLTATTQRSILRDALKKHKRLPTSQQAAHLGVVQDAVNGYFLMYWTEWRLTLSATLPGREPPRSPLPGIYNDVAFVLQTLAYIQVQQARSQIQILYSPDIPSPDRRTAAIGSAMKYLLEANSIHNYILNLHTQDPAYAPLDTVNSTQVALAALALAEATLITVLKDDPYTTAVIQARNKDDKDWMISAPSIPKVRAHLFARLCICASDHAQRAAASLAPGIGALDSSLSNYVDDLRRTSRAKAARFLACDAEATGKTGEAIAYLRGARRELGLAPLEQDASKRKGWKGIKQTFAEKREDRRVEKGADDWGLDAGKLEEARVLEWLEVKWVKLNDTINTQIIPPSEPLMAAMPSGREYHSPKAFTPPTLDASLLARLRAPIDPQQHAFRGNEDDSGDEAMAREPAVVPGAFPGAAPGGNTGNAYY